MAATSPSMYPLRRDEQSLHKKGPLPGSVRVAWNSIPHSSHGMRVHGGIGLRYASVMVRALVAAANRGAREKTAVALHVGNVVFLISVEDERFLDIRRQWQGAN